ncbi:unnamed protein product [Oppiella nova]|uniref:Uncharacterized protein n=1 Tax=Oppiella nova TaxID=334625 RepID=A0A7R9QKT4_9ACAR|nr:unnamed protein product [Oppiella nova]CAG2167959.1 unnamed protein product [Oppiella nova]
MIANTSQVGSIHMTAIHKMDSHLGPVYRFQGISVPKQLNINSYTFSILRERAQKLNSSKFLDQFNDKNVNEFDNKSHDEENLNKSFN